MGDDNSTLNVVADDVMGADAWVAGQVGTDLVPMSAVPASPAFT